MPGKSRIIHLSTATRFLLAPRGSFSHVVASVATCLCRHPRFRQTCFVSIAGPRPPRQSVRTVAMCFCSQLYVQTVRTVEAHGRFDQRWLFEGAGDGRRAVSLAKVAEGAGTTATFQRCARPKAAAAETAWVAAWALVSELRADPGVGAGRSWTHHGPQLCATSACSAVCRWRCRTAAAGEIAAGATAATGDSFNDGSVRRRNVVAARRLVRSAATFARFAIGGCSSSHAARTFATVARCWAG